MYDEELTGEKGMVVSARDANGNALLYQYEQYFDAENGDSLVTTLDKTVQYYLEKGLEELESRYGTGVGATGIVMDGHWANAPVSFLKVSGVTTGDDLGNFNPDSPITRQEFAVLLCRWLTPAQDTSSVELPFADNGSIADWAKDGVRAMYALGVTKGSYDGYGRL